MLKTIVAAILSAILIYGVAQQPVSSSSIQRGKKVYETSCLACHQADGSGVPRLNPPLIKTSYVSGDKKKLIKWVLQGSPDPKIEIDGEYYANNMPPQANLTDAEIADVLTYIRNSFGNKATTVTLGEIKVIRATIK